MAKKRRKLSPELEKNISLAKKQIELITAIIHDIDEDDIQEEYKSAFLPVMSAYMSLDQMYKDVGFNDETSKDNYYQKKVNIYYFKETLTHLKNLVASVCV